MDEEVRKTEEMLNESLAEIESHIAKLKLQNASVNVELRQVMQNCEAVENAAEALLRGDDLLSKEERRLQQWCCDKEREISSLQTELLGLFNAEKGQHKNVYEELIRSLKEMHCLKKEYDAVKLGEMLDNLEVNPPADSY